MKSITRRSVTLMINIAAVYFTIQAQTQMVTKTPEAIYTVTMIEQFLDEPMQAARQ